MDNRSLKDLLYEQVARVGKALASPKRLEILEMLAQGEKAVETIAGEVGIDVKLASAHLKALKEARLVQVKRDGKRMIYRLSGTDVAQLGVTLRQVAEEYLVELRLALQQMMAEPERLTQVGRKELLAQAKRGEVVVLDVRPPEEFDTAHLPYARSVPLPEQIGRAHV
jgi:DNA-binding transcriptional ArsR family regulator